MIKASDIKFKRSVKKSIYEHEKAVFTVEKNERNYIVSEEGKRITSYCKTLDDCRDMIAHAINKKTHVVGHFNAAMVAAVNVCRAKNDVRHYLKGVHVSPHPVQGVCIAATNGHFLAIAHDKDGYINRPVILSFDEYFLKKAHGNKQEMLGDRCIELAENIAYMTLEGRWEDEEKPQHGVFGDRFSCSVFGLQKLEVIDGKFPDLSRVLKLDPPQTMGPLSLNPQYVGKAHKVFNIYKPKSKSCGVLIQNTRQPDKEKHEADVSKIVTFHGHPEIAMIIMPMSYDEKTAVLPDWIKVVGNGDSK